MRMRRVGTRNMAEKGGGRDFPSCCGYIWAELYMCAQCVRSQPAELGREAVVNHQNVSCLVRMEGVFVNSHTTSTNHGTNTHPEWPAILVPACFTSKLQGRATCTWIIWVLGRLPEIVVPQTPSIRPINSMSRAMTAMQCNASTFRPFSYDDRRVKA